MYIVFLVKVSYVVRYSHYIIINIYNKNRVVVDGRRNAHFWPRPLHNTPTSEQEYYRSHPLQTNPTLKHAYFRTRSL